jgi:hypothetical protein
MQWDIDGAANFPGVGGKGREDMCVAVKGLMYVLEHRLPVACPYRSRFRLGG